MIRIPLPVRRRLLLLVPFALLVLTAFAGATPRSGPTLIVVNTTADTKGGDCGFGGEGTCSLREALALSEENELEGVVHIEIAVTGTIDAGADGELEVKPGAGVEKLEIEGRGPSELMISGDRESRVFLVESDEEVQISGMTIGYGAVTGHAIDGDGGAGLFANEGKIVLERVRLTENKIESIRDGAAIGIEEEASLRLIDSRVDHNLSEESGGGIYLETSGEILIEGTEILNNTAEEGYGGGVSHGEGSLAVSNSTFKENFALDDGGGLASTPGADIERTVFSGNRSEQSGGGLAAKGHLTLLESTVSQNRATESGGGVYTRGSSTIERSAIDGNSITSDSEESEKEGEEEEGLIEEAGGGIAVTEGEPMLLRNSTVSENSGGGVWDLGGVVTIRNSTIADNTTYAIPGAGIEGEEFVVQSSIIASNKHGAQVADCAGVVTSEGHNLLGMARDANGCSWNSAPGDIFGADPQLGPLGSYGGLTMTMPPVSAASPAINNGSNPPPPETFDQRGKTRPVPDVATDTDIGAVEVQAPFNVPGEPVTVVPNSELEVGDSLTCDPGGWNTDTITDPRYEYAWLVAGEKVAAGTGYVPTEADVGKQIACAVTVDDGAASATAESAAVEIPPARAAMTPTELDFGSHPVGSGPTAPRILTVKNEGGADLEVTAATSDSAEFPIDPSACVGTKLGPGDSCEIEASFDPLASGAQSSIVTVETDGGNVTSTLEGTGTAAVFSATPDPLEFGDQPTGTASAPRAVTVANHGDAPLAIGAVSVTGTDAADFAVAGDTCAQGVLRPGEECRVELTFTPAASGARTATLRFAEAGGPGAVGTVGLEGTGSPSPSPEPSPSTPGTTPPAPEPTPQPGPPGRIELKPHKGVLRVRGDGIVKLQLACPSSAKTACAATLVLSEAGRPRKQIGRRRVTVAAGATRAVSVRLDPTARRTLIESGRLTVVVVLSTDGGKTRARLRFRSPGGRRGSAGRPTA